MSDHNVSRLRGGGRESFSADLLAFPVPVPSVAGAISSVDNVASVCAARFAQFPVYFKPVTFLAVWLQHGLKREAIDGAFDRRHAARRKLRAGVLWQDAEMSSLPCALAARGGGSAAGRKSFALKRILEVVFVILLDNTK